MDENANVKTRPPLNTHRVLDAAVALADDAGIEALSMRSLARELGVVPMALYKHVANKEELLDGMVDVILGEIDPSTGGADWKNAIRQRVLSARRALLRHPWAPGVIESRTGFTPVVLDYMDSIIGMFRAGGLSKDLTHHVMHALGSRMWGFTQELFPSSPNQGPEAQAAMLSDMAVRYPNIVDIATNGAHDDESIVGQGCDGQFEFEFALDLLLDGFEKLHQQGWTSADHARGEKRLASASTVGASASVRAAPEADRRGTGELSSRHGSPQSRAGPIRS